MDHADHVRLLRDGVPREAGTWADLGAGTGAFTLALAELLPAGSLIRAVDRDAHALRDLEATYERFARGRDVPRVITERADFTRPLDHADLDGIVMANSLHFVKEKSGVLDRVRSALRPGGRLILVEYDTDRGNEWVPYPLTFATWQMLARANGFGEPVLLGTQPSRFLRGMYSALALARGVMPTISEV